MIVDACEGCALAHARFGRLHLPSTGSGSNTHFCVDLELVVLLCNSQRSLSNIESSISTCVG
jgi:hypothetical protein